MTGICCLNAISLIRKGPLTFSYWKLCITTEMLQPLDDVISRVKSGSFQWKFLPFFLQQKTVKSIEICMRFAYLKWNILQWVTDGLAGEFCELSSRGGFKKIELNSKIKVLMILSLKKKWNKKVVSQWRGKSNRSVTTVHLCTCFRLLQKNSTKREKKLKQFR